MVSLKIFDLNTGESRWYDLPVVPRIGEGLFFAGPNGMSVRRTVDDVTYHELNNAAWEVQVSVSVHD